MTRLFFNSFPGFPILALTVLMLATPLIVLVAEQQAITVYYFVAEGCEHCARVEDYISRIKASYPAVVFKRFEISNNDTSIELFVALTEGFNITEESREVPAVFIGDACLIGEEEVTKNLEKLMLEYSHGREYRDKAGEIIMAFIEQHPPIVTLPSLVSVVVAAFIDSLNPCAFATIVLLITYSLQAGSSRKMLTTCGAFITGVMASYLAAGIGLLYVISIALFRSILRYIVGSAAILFSILEFKEFFYYGKGFSLEQPGALSRILGKYSETMSVGAGLLVGMAVSMVELPCTGGIYITILYLLSKIGLTLEVFLLLFLYNLIFILPLIVILLTVYFGRSVVEIDAWRIEKRRYMRLLAGILLLTVGIAIIAGLI
ncbi:MAG: cytochrome c biogenesis protein CcdA [Candidatus Brockarchaeota archaeon]|nr:cytochrome c biogenesis protein CcdA [Candidatus Brockarchaeota archaeon]